MTNEARELSINELDAVSGGDPKTVKIGPLTITAGEGKLGIGITGVGGFLIDVKTGSAQGNIGKWLGSTT